jgi:hypothetical protein
VRPFGGEGYDWLLEHALELRGDLVRILALRPPAGSSIAFEQEFQSACLDLVDALLPVGVEFKHYLATHNPDDADARAVQDLARSRECAAG